MSSKLIQTTFNAGEWSELLDGRNDLAKYANALHRMENFIIDPRGPAVRRPGFKFIKGTKTNSKRAILIPFEFSTEQSYIIEMGDQYFRFYKDQSRIETSPGVAYEVSSPYLEADLSGISFCQSADVLYLFHNSYAPRKLSRTGHTSWTLSTINFRPAALKEQGIEPATTITLSATSGTGITVIAGGATFLAGDVHRIITSGAGRLSITAYTGSATVTADVIDSFSSVGPIASGSWAMSGTPSGTITPSIAKPVGGVATVTASISSFRSTDVGKYIRVHSGLLKITSYTSATEVKAEILSTLSAETATLTWTLESEVWSAENGYPCCGTFFEERLVLAGSTQYPETVWGSVVGDYENFTPGTGDADSFEFTLAGRQVNSIRWIYPMESLVLGTVGGEWSIGSDDISKSLTPLNVVAKERRSYGSSTVNPVKADGSVLFAQRAGRKIREFTYSWEQNGFVAPDLTLLAEHITEGVVAGMVYQQEPHSIVWVWLEDGSLIALTYMRDQDVIGWHKHPMNGLVESMAVIPGDGYDEVWAVVNRTINGGTVRYVEMMSKMFSDTAAQYQSNKGLNAFFVDSGITYSGASTNTITGLNHLEGETVAVLGNGSAFSNKTVSGGQITLGRNVTVAHVGLPIESLLETMRLDANTVEGTGQGAFKKIHEIIMRVYRSGSFKAGRDENNLDNAYDRERELILGDPYTLFTGDIRAGYDDNWETEGKLTIVQDSPLPLTVLCLIKEVTVK